MSGGPAAPAPTKTRAWAGIATAALVIVVAYVIVDRIRGTNELTRPDTPPGEYLYLDRARVLSYLGQLVDGLPSSEKRTLAESEDLTAELKGGPASLAGGRKTSSSSEAQVAPSVADRFYLLLRLLRVGKSRSEASADRSWLFDVGAQTSKPTQVYERMCSIREGDFVRIRNAHLYLPPFAAILPKATYAALNLTPTKKVTPPPAKRILTPRTVKERTAVAEYRKLLGRNPRLPFIVPTLSPNAGRGQPSGVTFFVPTRYHSLRNEPSLISGTLTIVGKVVYLNLARIDDKTGRATSCGNPAEKTVPLNYVDRLTMATFVPALKGALPFVTQSLHVPKPMAETRVAANIVVRTPIAVVVPIAMYQ